MASVETGTRAPAQMRKFPLTTLIAMVVGSMVGAGVFSLPRNFALSTGIFGALIAWVIAGTGMLMLAFVFQTLAVRKPGLSSAGIWIFHTLISRGVQGAATVNKIVTVAKIVPILTFVVVTIFALKAHVFSANFWGGEPKTASALFAQVRATMLTTVFVFLGIEGASVYSRYAKRRQDVGRATVLGFLGVLVLFASVTIFSYGILPRAGLEHLRQPSMAGVMEAAVGSWGKAFISVGVVVSVLGAYLAWTLMAAEVLFVSAQDRDMPAFLARASGRNVPVPALVMTSVLVQVMLAVTLFSEDAFTFTLKLCSSLSLIPYLLAAGYALKLGARGETY